MSQKDGVEAKEQRDHLPVYPETLQKMVVFVRNNGGRVRFDRYMNESLFGEEGFYSNRVKIAFGGDFATNALDSQFAELISDHVTALGSSGNTFIEIGGGDGTFKRNFLGLNPEVNYVSVEASPKLAALQQSVDGKSTIRSSVTSLPFPTSSVEGTIFGNELLDALPCRVFKLYTQDDGRIEVVSEGVVTTSSDNESLKLNFEDIEKDEFVIEYEEFLNAYGRQVEQQGEVVSVSPHFRKLLTELDRVLNKGMIVLIDYGFHENYVTMMGKDNQELPYFKGQRGIYGIDKILERPYETDITYAIDFKYLKWLAKRVNPKTIVSFRPQHYLFREVRSKSGKEYNDKWMQPIPNVRFGVLEIGKLNQQENV